MDPKDVLNEVIAGLDAREAEKVAEADKAAAEAKETNVPSEVKVPPAPQRFG
mgnify:CR=1 FL=1